MTKYQKIGITIITFCLTVAAAPSGDSFSVVLENVQKVQDKVYTGTAGKTQLAVYTGECFHEPPKGEQASFTWAETTGHIIFRANEDYCDVKSYKKN